MNILWKVEPTGSPNRLDVLLYSKGAKFKICLKLGNWETDLRPIDMRKIAGRVGTNIRERISQS